MNYFNYHFNFVLLLQLQAKPRCHFLEIVDLNSEKKSVFSFIPVNVTCDDQGLTTWAINKKSTNRYIFHVEDLSKYEVAMTKALKTMLLELPK